jgi:fused signal recognition particle receptor
MNQDEIELKQDIESEEETQGFFARLKNGLAKTRHQIMDGVNQVFNGFSSIDEDFYEELEEALIMADIGVHTSTRIVEDIKEQVDEQKIKEPLEVRQLLKEEIQKIMFVNEDQYDFIHKKTVLLVIGVNGVGKTTTIGKLANQYRLAGKNVVLAAADTFRAAAIDQLREWAYRSQVSIIAGQENSDPGAVIYDAIASAKSKDADILICDTAGRLHNKKNLMDELGKMFKIINKEYPEAHKEVLIVLDSTTGQNALQQAKQFNEIADISGIVLTKLDGTAKGGIVIAIQDQL